MAKNSKKTKVFWPKIAFLDFPGQTLSNQGRGFPFGAFPGTDIFWDPQPPNFNENPYPYSGLSQFLAASHATLWTDQIPDLWIYVVIAVWGPSCVPKYSFSSFLARIPPWLFFAGVFFILVLPVALPLENTVGVYLFESFGWGHGRQGPSEVDTHHLEHLHLQPAKNPLS